jgi:hypothetical protein
VPFLFLKNFENVRFPIEESIFQKLITLASTRLSNLYQHYLVFGSLAPQKYTA